jgi:hypothetical protein
MPKLTLKSHALELLKEILVVTKSLLKPKNYQWLQKKLYQWLQKKWLQKWLQEKWLHKK